MSGGRCTSLHACFLSERIVHIFDHSIVRMNLCFCFDCSMSTRTDFVPFDVTCTTFPIHFCNEKFWACYKENKVDRAATRIVSHATMKTKFTSLWPCYNNTFCITLTMLHREQILYYLMLHVWIQSKQILHSIATMNNF
jgi:hypothetical protein